MTDEEFLASYPPAIRKLMKRTCALIERTVPSAERRLRVGWKLIGYSAPHYFAFAAPQPQEVRLGFEWGVLLPDPQKLLRGNGTQVRDVPISDEEPLRNPALAHLIELASRMVPPPRKR